MVSQIINVIVNSQGVATVKKQLDQMGDSAKQTTTYLNGLRAILAAALTFSGASAIVEIVDNFTTLQNRLKLVSDGADEVATTWTNLMNIANQSYSSIDSTVTLYQRVAQAYDAWGKSASEATEFTELFQKAAVLSGSSVQTTAQAVYQFGQALNKGKLDGDEFKSVLEGLPYVAKLIESQLGVTRRELYQMSADGKISVDQLAAAFTNAAAVIRGDFANITPTIGMALVVLKNNWTDFIGSIQTSTGIFSGIARVILLVANNFELLALALTPVALSMAFLGGRLALGLVVIGLKDMASALQLATVAQWLFNAAVTANPYVLAAVAIGALIAAIIYFREELGLTNEFFATLWNTASKVFSSIISALTPAAKAVASIVGWMVEWNIQWLAVKSTVGVLIAVLQSLWTGAISGAQALVSYLVSALGPAWESIKELVTALIGLYGDLVNVISSALKPAIDGVTKAFTSFWEYAEPAFNVFTKTLQDIYAGWVAIAQYISTKFGPIVKDIFEGWLLIIKKVIDWITKLINLLRQALQLMAKAGAGAADGGGGGVTANYGAQFYAGEFANGGGFKVGGDGVGRDTTAVAFRANRGERVTVETKKQQRQADNGNGGSANVNVPVTIMNVFDPSMMPKANMSASGQKSIVNVIADNRDEVKQILGVA